MDRGAIDDPWDVPASWSDAAEEVRAHLCLLRGGAPFLSPADSFLLVGWLEQQVPIADILRALERAVEARRQSRSKVPLRLGHAKRHLGRASRGVFGLHAPARGGGEPPLAPVVRALQSTPVEADPAPRRDLERALLDVRDTGDAGVRAGLEHVRVFLERVWEALGPAGQHRLRARAEEELGDLLALVDEATALALVDETARDLVRRGYPALSAASLWELVGTDG